jgi:hypothetical protein
MIPKTLNSHLGKAKNRDPTIPKKIMNNVIVFGLNCHFTNFVEKKGEICYNISYSLKCIRESFSRNEYKNRIIEAAEKITGNKRKNLSGGEEDSSEERI